MASLSVENGSRGGDLRTRSQKVGNGRDLQAREIPWGILSFKSQVLQNPHSGSPFSLGFGTGSLSPALSMTSNHHFSAHWPTKKCVGFPQ